MKGLRESIKVGIDEWKNRLWTRVLPVYHSRWIECFVNLYADSFDMI